MIDVFEAVLPLKSVYMALGRSLRLKTADLKLIQEAYPNESDIEQALSDTLELWLQQKYNVERFGPPTWRMLVETVDRKAGGNNHDLAKEIASDHPAAGIVDNSNSVYSSNTYIIHIYIYSIYTCSCMNRYYINSLIPFQYMQVLIMMMLVLHNLHNPVRRKQKERMVSEKRDAY